MMPIRGRCVGRNYNTNNILESYKILYETGEVVDVDKHMLKNCIENGRIVIDNLKLTSGNKLVDTKRHTDTHKKCVKLRDNIVTDMLNKSKALNLYVKDFNVQNTEHKIYFIQTNEDTITILIPDNVKRIGSINSFLRLYGSQIINVTVIGGRGLNSASSLFQNIVLKTLDISKLDTSKVVDMQWMFAECRIEHIIGMDNFSTKNVRTMEHMFSISNIKQLDFNNFDTRKVENMEGMFYYATIPNIDISGFNTYRVNNMRNMFKFCKSKSVNIYNFDLSSIINIENMFIHCNIDDLYLGNFRDKLNIIAKERKISSRLMHNVRISNIHEG